jgi:hypothetical protein
MNMLESVSSLVTGVLPSHADNNTCYLPRHYCSLCDKFLWRINEITRDEGEWKLLVTNLL